MAPELCACELDRIRKDPGMCFAGDFDYARDVMMRQACFSKRRLCAARDGIEAATVRMMVMVIMMP